MLAADFTTGPKVEEPISSIEPEAQAMVAAVDVFREVGGADLVRCGCFLLPP
jgi:hypothetical protein